MVPARPQVGATQAGATAGRGDRRPGLRRAGYDRRGDGRRAQAGSGPLTRRGLAIGCMLGSNMTLCTSFRRACRYRRRRLLTAIPVSADRPGGAFT
jgi:hypothetical protein